MSKSFRSFGGIRCAYYSEKSFCTDDMDVGLCQLNTKDCVCMTCEKDIEHLSFFCSYCDKIQSNCLLSNFFELFELPEKEFDIDLDILHEKYRDIQKTIHPDGLMKKGDEVVDFATRMSARLNDAYNTLKKPNLRANYILELEGVYPKENFVDSRFLTDMVEKTFLIEEGNLSVEEIEEILGEIQLLVEQQSDLFEKAYSKHDLKNASLASSRMNYAQRLIDIANEDNL